MGLIANFFFPLKKLTYAIEFHNSNDQSKYSMK